MPLSLRSRLCFALALLPACGPASPGQSEASDTGTTDTADTDNAPTEATPTEPTGGPQPEECGACQTLLAGDVSPTGVTAIDGFILAAENFRTHVRTIESRFAADIRALADIYGLPLSPIDSAFVSQLVAAIQADIQANVDLLDVVHVPGRCSSALDIGAEALRACQIDGGCGVLAPAERPPVECEGTCTGACQGSCSGPLSCVVFAPSVQCEGLCQGACTVEAGAACDGTCHGECSGQCTLVDAVGSCSGACDGLCLGTCDSPAPTVCQGTCDGLCLVEQGSAQCFGEVTCRGACDGGCEGECAGEATPASSVDNCAATALCQPQAAAQASVDLVCAPPILELVYIFLPNVDAGARGSFSARARALELHGAAILQDADRLSLLINGSQGGAVVYDPAPIASLTGSLASIVGAGVDSFGLPEARRECAIPALQAAIKALSDTTSEAVTTIAAQVTFAAFITSA